MIHNKILNTSILILMYVMVGCSSNNTPEQNELELSAELVSSEIHQNDNIHIIVTNLSNKSISISYDDILMYKETEITGDEIFSMSIIFDEIYQRTPDVIILESFGNMKSTASITLDPYLTNLTEPYSFEIKILAFEYREDGTITFANRAKIILEITAIP